MYWTNMGVPNLNDGSIERADLDGRNRKTIVPEGGTFTPKQLHSIEANTGKLYWCDREGMRVMRANLDGSNVETLVDTSQGDPRPGPRSDEMVRRDHRRSARAGTSTGRRKGPDNGEQGRIFRAGIDIPRGEKPAHRSDIEVLFDAFAGADRSRARPRASRPLLDGSRRSAARQHRESRADRRDAKPGAPEIVLTHLMEGIGLALDVPGDRMFVTDFGGSVYSARLDGSEKRMLLYAQGNLTGIAYAEIVRKGEVIMSYDKPIHRIAIVGTGVIGASWAAQYLARGFDVVATDPAPNAEANLRKYVDDAWPVLDEHRPVRRRVAGSAELHDRHEGGAVGGRLRPGKRPRAAGFQDQAVRRHGRRDACRTRSSPRARRGSRRASCSRSAQHPERVLVGHPFNPPHIIPLVEVVGGAKTSPTAIQQAMAFYASIGKKPIHLRQGAARPRRRTGSRRRSIARSCTSFSRAC